MRLYVIRHGHKASETPDYDGGPDTPLTETGHQQAERVAAFLAEEDIDRLYSSCQRRALQTTEPIDDRIQAEWNVWPVFCESSTSDLSRRIEEDPQILEHLAAWRDTSLEDWAATEPEPYDRGGYRSLSTIDELYETATLTQPFPWPDAWWLPLRNQVHSMGYARVELGINTTLSHADPEDHVAIVCHGNSGDQILSTLMDFPRRHQRRRFAFDHTGVARLDRLETGDWRIRYTNRTDHLPPTLKT